MPLALELAVQDPAGMRIAREVGAARVELAQALALGGLTPSRATIELTREAAGESGPEVHVLVRARAGDFIYTDDEIALMAVDVRHALDAGAHGVVIGCQDADGTLNRDGLARLVDAAEGAPVTLHRVIDVTPDLFDSLRIAQGVGVRRVLSSGGASTAIEGIEALRSLVGEAHGAIEIMAGSGITASDVAAIADAGVDAVHFSAKRSVVSDSAVRMGSAADGVGAYEITDRATALAVVAALAPAVA
ncbi:copper homeostasis protein CutC [Microbacterium sp. H1-D42]|uniref:copper homeostasis protein CutC n=1 Tax=Microbacterium sp. H1-D42 TaxID=2925844 RepID=UPI001F53158D|nr:copper homeostasis protein CutC [Microbacterium sp. H1-D42]UNK71339.1 hypothetical protein MNR00_02475 [Microbacterium sp. H1-D42]